MLKMIYKIFEKIFILLLICCICVLGYYVCQRLINKDKQTKMFGYYMFEVTSWSMYNENYDISLSKGDLIFVKERDISDYEVGMVVTYLLDDSNIPVTHQIIERDGDTIITKGINEENNTASDTPFDVKYILGEVVGSWHNYSAFMNFVKSPIGIICIVIFGIVIFETFTLIDKKLISEEE